MIFGTLKNVFFDRGFFSKNDILAHFETFDKNNLTRWCAKGYLIKLRNNYYTFPEYLKKQYFTFFLANQIFPSAYVSLHTALAYHGYIANYINTQISSISAQKTITFKNIFGNFHYQKEQSTLLFGFEEKGEPPFTFRIAEPEKAILDLFYLYPNYYDTEQKIQNFALEEKMIYENMNIDKLYNFMHSFQNQSLERRIMLFVRIYGL